MMYLHQNLPNCGAVCQTNPLSLYTTAAALLLLGSLGILVIVLNKQTNNIMLMNGLSEIFLLVKTTPRKIVNSCFVSQEYYYLLSVIIIAEMRPPAVIRSRAESSRMRVVFHRWPMHKIDFIIQFKKRTLVTYEVVIKP